MDRLYEFACAFLQQNPVSAGMAAEGPRSNIAGVGAQLLFRQGQFQVQMFTVPPHYIIPAHTHPDVDSFEVYIDGPIKFSHRGSFVFETAETVVPPDPSSFGWRMLRVNPEDRHGAVTGAASARFISIQRWLNEVPPSCVAANYSGPVMDIDHFAQVNSGKPEARSQADLTEADAL
jgi:hypothetical protein